MNVFLLKQENNLFFQEKKKHTQMCVTKSTQTTESYSTAFATAQGTLISERILLKVAIEAQQASPAKRS